MPSSRRQGRDYRDSDRPRSGRDHTYSTRARRYSDYDDRGPRRRDADPDRRRPPRSRDDEKRARSERSQRRASRSSGGALALNSKTSQAVTAALTAGALEAIKVRREPGKWVGEKGVRVARAAIGAAAVDATVSKNKDPGEKSKKDVAGATAAGLLVNSLLANKSKG